jgi:hypothetical protein
MSATPEGRSTCMTIKITMSPDMTSFSLAFPISPCAKPRKMSQPMMVNIIDHTAAFSPNAPGGQSSPAASYDSQAPI